MKAFFINEEMVNLEKNIFYKISVIKSRSTSLKLSLLFDENIIGSVNIYQEKLSNYSVCSTKISFQVKDDVDLKSINLKKYSLRTKFLFNFDADSNTEYVELLSLLVPKSHNESFLDSVLNPLNASNDKRFLNSIPKPKRNPSSAFKKISTAPIKVSEHDQSVIDEKETINMESVYPEVDNLILSNKRKILIYEKETINMKSVYPEVDKFILSNEQKIEWLKGFQILKGFE